LKTGISPIDVSAPMIVTLSDLSSNYLLTL
jgi:hypothetical protein